MQDDRRTMQSRRRSVDVSGGPAAGARGLVALCLAALLAVLGGCGDDDSLPGLRKHRDPDLSFFYPEGWQLTHDTFELDTPDSRVLILRAPGDGIVMIHRFMPASGWTLEEFATQFSKLRAQRLTQEGLTPPDRVETSATSLQARGYPIQGVRQDFSLERQGVTSDLTSLFFEVDRAGAQVFISAHVSRLLVPTLTRELKPVLSSIRGGALARVDAEP